ncbi:DNA mismatch repair endonuclease MutL, partial [Anaerococcus hydrogenalis]|uniref:DNA mismatch repair endonuclease MutL n=1 Tax=Anaerococcus hydrogenalis TaxID=33029 RepID=UPI00290530BB
SPVSIIKELVENSIDAKAKNIIVEIKNGGKSYIRVTDDGIGIDEDDFERAFKRHATSKIKDFSDLYRIFSLGFRGEALSSIVSCADVKAVSKTKNQDIGKKLEFKNGKLESINSIATNNGTSIEVFNLFSNLPVRRKFLGSDINESNKISKIIQALALGYDNISFKFIKDNRLVFQTLESDSLKDRIFKLIDNNLKDNLIKIRSKNSLYDISGYISSTNYYRGNRSFQYIFVNNRLIENSNITKTVENNYKSLIPNQRFPVFFLFITTNTSNIDVNIHPNKKEIKFTYEDSLLELLDGDISKFLYDNSDFKKVKALEEDKEELNFYDDYTEVLNLYNKVNEEKNSYEQEFHDDRSYNNVDDDFFEVEELNFIEEKDDEKSEYKNIEKNKKKQLINIKNLLYKTSIFNRYSLFINSDKILLLDHRRADQRIKFDEFIENFNKDKINSQQLLEAKIIKVSLEEYNKYLEKKEIFKKLGFEIDTFSFDKLIIRSVPIVFDNPENLEFFYNLLDIDDSNESLFKEKISSLINKNTFRKGDKIDESEALATINKLNKSENPYKTYDGKSTIITIEENELEKYFDR